MFLEMANKVMAGTVSIESFSDVDLALYMKQLKKKMEVRDRLTVIADNRVFTTSYRSPSIASFHVKTINIDFLVGFSFFPLRRRLCIRKKWRSLEKRIRCFRRR
jgi:hypothetical protein